MEGYRNGEPIYDGNTRSEWNADPYYDEPKTEDTVDELFNKYVSGEELPKKDLGRLAASHPELFERW